MSAEVSKEEKVEKLKQSISLLEQQISKEEFNLPSKVACGMDRMTYLKSKLSIFKNLFLRYTSGSTSAKIEKFE